MTCWQTSLMRALSPTTPTYIFPAMNTLMFEHPLTEQHLRTLKEVIGYNIVGPIGKKLACGDIGSLLLLHMLRCGFQPDSYRCRCNDGMESDRAHRRRAFPPGSGFIIGGPTLTPFHPCSLKDSHVTLNHCVLLG